MAEALNFNRVSSETTHKVKFPHKKKKTRDPRQVGSASADVLQVATLKAVQEQGIEKSQGQARKRP